MKRKQHQSSKLDQSIKKEFPIPKTGWIGYVANVFKGISILGLVVSGIFFVDLIMPNQTVKGEIKFIKEFPEEVYVEAAGIHFLIDAPPLNYFNSGDIVTLHLSPILGILHKVSIKDSFFGERVERPFGNRVFGIAMLLFFVILISLLNLNNKREASPFNIVIGLFNLLFMWFLFIQVFTWPELFNF